MAMKIDFLDSFLYTNNIPSVTFDWAALFLLAEKTTYWESAK
jgi:hypothetical protein